MYFLRPVKNRNSNCDRRSMAVNLPRAGPTWIQRVLSGRPITRAMGGGGGVITLALQDPPFVTQSRLSPVLTQSAHIIECVTGRSTVGSDPRVQVHPQQGGAEELFLQYTYIHTVPPFLHFRVSILVIFIFERHDDNLGGYSKSFSNVHFPSQRPLRSPDDPIQKTKHSEDAPDNGTNCCQEGSKGPALLSLDDCHGRNIKVEKDT